MYNGIGLQTARGTGTNGYVQRNLSCVRTNKEKVEYKPDEEIQKLEAYISKKGNAELLKHDRKRKIEVKCLEMEEMMTEQGLDYSIWGLSSIGWFNRFSRFKLSRG